jgi:hypothetical protein
VAATYAVTSPMQDAEQPLAAAVADLATVSQIEVRDGNTVVLSGQFGAEVADDDEIKRTALLTSAAGGAAKGEAEIELDADNRANQELEVAVEDATARVTLQVFLDGQLAGTFQTNARGKGNMELSRGTDTQ